MNDEELQLIPIEELRRLVRLGRMVDRLRSESVLESLWPGEDGPSETAQVIRVHVKAARAAVEALAQQILLSEPARGADFARATARRWYGIIE